ncbi:DUF5666 domain-containing protein [Wansuia hejianensis]|uniref:Copper amine oxidase N-terminal domain-containing protein n=1 Tax=Wansuia hejianensis TaxID=2763667 RepID=A0A926F3T2_9FIRM|nr:DUF5666 domain-containing protein [Wansuia hejianensis]MBC8591369.1 copper amine oxidase N-terminal domain-containing protein [Wansuia hejianensis]
MKKRLLSMFLVLTLIISLATPIFAMNNTMTEEISNAVYLGVVGYGTVDAADKDNFQYRFSIDGDEMIFKVSNENDYAINNILAEGYVFDLTVDENNKIVDAKIPEPSAMGTIESINTNKIKVNGVNIKINDETDVYEIINMAGRSEVKESSLKVGESVKVYGNPASVVYLTFVAEPYEAVVSGTAGQRTLKNFLATAMEPVGTVLYIYGGTWDWQDVGSSNQATTIGLSQTWIDFFQSNDDTFTYRNSKNHAKSYYPHKRYNEYYYAGIDCSGYVGWVLYNVMNNESGKEGFVQSASTMAKTFAETYNYGTWTQDFTNFSFKPGDVFSMPGHVWICLGVCDDGSLVILHSTPSNSYSGNPGGGVQLSGIGESEDCQAYALAQEYMERYFPQWSDRYPAVFRSYSSYTSMPNNYTGKFSWNLDETGLLDPDGYAEMSAEEVLKDLFSENTILEGKDMVEKANELGITPGKLNLIYKLMDAADGVAEINVEDWIDRSVQEIQREIKFYKRVS